MAGSSIGALLGCLICTHDYSEMATFFDPYLVFGHPMVGLTTKTSFEFVWRFLRGEPVLDTSLLKKYITRFTGEITFKEMYDRFGWNFNVTVTDQSE